MSSTSASTFEKAVSWTLANLVDELRRRAELDPSDVVRGQLAGITSDAPPPLRTEAGVLSDVYRAGFLAGKIYARLAQDCGVLSDELLLTGGIYAASLAQGAVEERFEAPSTRVLVVEHNAACLRIAWKQHSLGDSDEAALFAWLADALGLPVDDELAGGVRASTGTPLAEGRLRAGRLRRRRRRVVRPAGMGCSAAAGAAAAALAAAAVATLAAHCTPPFIDGRRYALY